MHQSGHFVIILYFSKQGWLYKWTNRIKGYQKRWFVISNNDFLVYFLSEGDTNARGWIRLQGSSVYTLGNNGVSFAISSAEGVTIKMRAAGVTECQRWMETLSNHGSKHESSDIRVKPGSSGISEEEEPENEPRDLPALIDEIAGCAEHIGNW